MQVTKETSRMREQYVPGALSDFRASRNEDISANVGKVSRCSVACILQVIETWAGPGNSTKMK